ncbi:MAG: twin-arginine translocation signal domain-containing protein, partial [Terriglobia bacterium]
MNPASRREFLKLAAAFGASATLAERLHLVARTCAVQVRGLSTGSRSKAADLTDGGLRYPALRQPSYSSASSFPCPAALAAVTIFSEIWGGTTS